jgi:hypothetical protein
VSGARSFIILGKKLHRLFPLWPKTAQILPQHLSLLLKQPAFPISWLSALVRNGNYLNHEIIVPIYYSKRKAMDKETAGDAGINRPCFR